eukprot:447331-Heterocapsa_arctica.AAC.1
MDVVLVARLTEVVREELVQHPLPSVSAEFILRRLVDDDRKLGPDGSGFQDQGYSLAIFRSHPPRLKRHDEKDL